MRELERQVVLQVLDRKWREHLYEMDYLRRASGCGRWRSATRWWSTSARASTCSPRCWRRSRRSRSASCSTCRCRRLRRSRSRAAPVGAAPVAAAPVDDAVSRTQPNPVVTPAAARTARPRWRATGRARHAAPEGDADRHDGRAAGRVRRRPDPSPDRAAVQRACRGRQHHPPPRRRDAGHRRSGCGGCPGRRGRVSRPATALPVRVGTQVQALSRRADGRPLLTGAPSGGRERPLGSHDLTAAAG